MFEYQEKYHFPICNMLNVTDACNLACRYCFVEQHPHFMTLDVAKRAVDWTYENYLKRKEHGNFLFNTDDDLCIINFFGGEPLLLYDEIIVPTILYAEEKYPKRFGFGLTTNCTLLTNDKVDFLHAHNVGILTSLDGIEETQCYNRPCRNGDNSFKLIEKNLPYFLKVYSDKMTVFRSTGYGPTIHTLFQNYLYAESLGFSHFEMIPDNRHRWTKQQLLTLQNEMSKIFIYRMEQKLNHNVKMEVKSWDRNTLLFQHMAATGEDVSPNVESYGSIFRCGLGTTSVGIGWDGKIYGCQQDVSYDQKNIFYIGDIYNGIDSKKHNKLLTRYLKQFQSPQLLKKDCKTCKLKKFCKSYANVCISTNYYLLNNFFGLTKMHCFYAQLIYKLAIIELNIMNEIQLTLENQEGDEITNAS